MVWHHRRNSVRTYWRQQQGYGKAEALLEGKWPEKYNAAGHLTWGGRLYSKGPTQPLSFSRERIHYGMWGAGLFQSIYEPAAGRLTSLPLMPEWLFVVFALGVLTALGCVWTPLLATAPLFVFALAAPVAQAVLSARRAEFTSSPATRRGLLKLQAMTALLHLMQPLARLKGRLRWGLTPWRRRGVRGWAAPRTRPTILWSETWRSREERLSQLEARLRDAGACVLRGGEFDRWDLEVRGGMLGAARVLTTVEEHGAGRQLMRARARPRVSKQGLTVALLVAAPAGLAAWDGAWLPAFVLAGGALFIAARMLLECGAAMSTMLRALDAEAETARLQSADEDAAPEPSPSTARPEPSAAPVAVAQFEAEG